MRGVSVGGEWSKSTRHSPAWESGESESWPGESKKSHNFGHETRKEVLEGRVSTKALLAWTSSRTIKS